MKADREVDERFAHRLEAFSDIVIGFSLAQLGATLVVRPTSELIAHPGWIGVFLWTFALVCLLWWHHNRIFRAGFTPTFAAVVCNFALLATIVLIVYFAQVFARSPDVHDGIVAARLYFGMLVLNYLATAFLYRLGHRPGAAVIFAVSGSFLLAVILVSTLAGDDTGALLAMAVAVPIGFRIGTFVERWTTPRSEPT